MDPEERGGGSWTLLTGHGRVLVEIAWNARARIRDIAAAAGIAERTAQAIVADLEADVPSACFATSAAASG